MNSNSSRCSFVYPPLIRHLIILSGHANPSYNIWTIWVNLSSLLLIAAPAIQFHFLQVYFVGNSFPEITCGGANNMTNTILCVFNATTHCALMFKWRCEGEREISIYYLFIFIIKLYGTKLSAHQNVVKRKFSGKNGEEDVAEDLCYHKSLNDFPSNNFSLVCPSRQRSQLTDQAHLRLSNCTVTPPRSLKFATLGRNWLSIFDPIIIIILNRCQSIR